MRGSWPPCAPRNPAAPSPRPSASAGRHERALPVRRPCLRGRRLSRGRHFLPPSGTAPGRTLRTSRRQRRPRLIRRFRDADPLRRSQTSSRAFTFLPAQRSVRVMDVSGDAGIRLLRGIQDAGSPIHAMAPDRRSAGDGGARGGSRTPTPFRAPGPKPGASSIPPLSRKARLPSGVWVPTCARAME